MSAATPARQPPPRLLACGDGAVLIEADDTTAALSWAAAVRASALPWIDVVPGARTVLVSCEPRDLAAVRTALADLDTCHVATESAATVTIDVVYDGADLDQVAALTGLTVHEVVTAHTTTPWRVAFSGFAPGFGYLTGGDPRLAVPRRATSRTRVPAGSVGLAGEFSGIYPRESPGGWQLIGRTDADLWDEHRDPPALLVPGAHVVFRRVGP